MDRQRSQVASARAVRARLLADGAWVGCVNSIILRYMSGWRKRVQRMWITLLVIYVLVCIWGCAFQRRLIYFPTKLSVAAVEQAAAQNGFSPWRNQNGQIIGWKIAAKDSSA